MLDNTARYIYTVYRLKSVCLAAQELYLSQPALSRAIKKAEDGLGYPIFNRKTHPFSLTPEGKVYIQSIEKMLEIEKEAAEKISDLHHTQGGTLRIATSLHFSYYLIPKLLKAFQKKHPQVDIHIILTDTNRIYENLQKDMADLIFVAEEAAPEGYSALPLLDIRNVVALPRYMIPEKMQDYALSYAELIGRSYSADKEIPNLSGFRGIDFIYTPPNTNIQKKRKNLISDTAYTSYITASANRQQLNYNLMRSGFGALLTTDANIATMTPRSDCAFFVLSGSASRQSFFMVCRKEQDCLHNPLIKEFAHTARKIFSDENPLPHLTDI